MASRDVKAMREAVHKGHIVVLPSGRVAAIYYGEVYLEREARNAVKNS